MPMVCCWTHEAQPHGIVKPEARYRPKRIHPARPGGGLQVSTEPRDLTRVEDVEAHKEVRKHVNEPEETTNCIAAGTPGCVTSRSTVAQTNCLDCTRTAGSVKADLCGARDNYRTIICNTSALPESQAFTRARKAAQYVIKVGVQKEPQRHVRLHGFNNARMTALSTHVPMAMLHVATCVCPAVCLNTCTDGVAEVIACGTGFSAA